MNLFTFIGNTLESANAVVTNTTEVLVNTTSAASNYSKVVEVHAEHTLNIYQLENAAEISRVKNELEELTISLD